MQLRLKWWTQPSPLPSPPKKSYWEQRKNMVYLQHIYALVSLLGRNARSLIDVGTNGCPYLEWFQWIPVRLSIDLRAPYSSPTVHGVKSDFLAYQSEQKFDFATCFQVLEHLQDPRPFAQKLLSLAPKVLISVPLLWPKGVVHPQDPVDLEKIHSWFGRAPDFQLVSAEHVGIQRRLICYFEGPGSETESQKSLLKATTATTSQQGDRA